jgi:hypothetical protein
MPDSAAVRNRRLRARKRVGERIATVRLTNDLVEGLCAGSYLSDPKAAESELGEAVRTAPIVALAGVTWTARHASRQVHRRPSLREGAHGFLRAPMRYAVRRAKSRGAT